MRLEYKFLIANKNFDLLQKKLTPFIVPDNYHNTDNKYTVRSIYFDTSSLKFYHDKIDGISIRKKVRVRGYNSVNENSVIFLEIKRKHENFTDKDRSALMYHDLDDLLRTKDIEGYVLTENGYADSQEDAMKFLNQIYQKSLRPIILVVYDREAFYSKFDSRLRITLDMNLRYFMFPSLNKLYSDKDLVPTLTKHFILEVKFSKGFPSWLQSIIREMGLNRQALSKYTICLNQERMYDPVKRKSVIAYAQSIQDFEVD